MEDFQQLRQPDQIITVWGEVATLQLVVSAGPDYDRELLFRLYGGFPYEDFPYEGRSRERSILEEAIQEAVALHLGRRGFQFRVDVRPGSIVIVIIIQAAHAVYQTIAQYKDFRESLPLLLSDIRTAVNSVLSRTVPPDQLTIDSALTPGSAVLYAEAMTMFNNAVGRIRTPLIALVVSNLLLLLIAATVLILQFV